MVNYISSKHVKGAASYERYKIWITVSGAYGDLLVFWDSLPANIPIHFNWFGDADNIVGKWSVAIGIPVLGFLGHICYMWLLDKKPQWIGRKGVHKYSFLYFPILTCCIMILLLWNAS